MEMDLKIRDWDKFKDLFLFKNWNCSDKQVLCRSTFQFAGTCCMVSACSSTETIVEEDLGKTA